MENFECLFGVQWVLPSWATLLGWDGFLCGKEEKGSLESKPFMRFLDGWEGKEQNYV